MDTINFIVSKNVKRVRVEKDLSLDELAKLSGVSKSMLVQIERGSGNPSLSTLWKIANGMNVTFDTLVAQPKAPFEIVRLSEVDPILGSDGKIKNYLIFPDNENRHFSIYYMEVQPGCFWESEPHTQGTIEFVTVFCGALEITEEDHVFQIREGESIRFKANAVHSYRNTGDGVLVFHNILYNPQ